MIEIVINPAGQSGRTWKVWKRLEPIVQNAGVPYRVHCSTPELGITEICRSLTDKEVDLVVVGGDGTFNEAVNGIVDFGKTRIGLIPCGSGNDLALAIGLSRRPEKALKKVLEGKVRRIVDVGEIVFHNESDFLDLRTRSIQPGRRTEDRCRRFNISAGIGFDAAICQQVALSSLKGILNRIHLGRLCYILEAIRIVFTRKLIPAEIRFTDKTVQYSRCLLAVGMNHCYEGGGFKFCPQADDSDGYLDFCIGDGLSRFDFFRIFPYAYSGRHVRFSGIYTERDKEVRILTKEPVWVHTDGEVTCRSSDITLRLLQEKMQMIV